MYIYKFCPNYIFMKWNLPKKTDKKSMIAAIEASKSNDFSEASKLSTELKLDNVVKLRQDMDITSDNHHSTNNS